MKASLRSSAVSGMLWTAMERFGHQFLRLIIGIIIARILEPSMFGIVGMTVIFTDLAQSILDSGFGSALIQKKDRNEVDYSTCFYFNVIVGLFLYVILFIAAPHIAVSQLYTLMHQSHKIKATPKFKLRCGYSSNFN